MFVSYLCLPKKSCVLSCCVYTNCHLYLDVQFSSSNNVIKIADPMMDPTMDDEGSRDLLERRS